MLFSSSFLWNEGLGWGGCTEGNAAGNAGTKEERDGKKGGTVSLDHDRKWSSPRQQESVKKMTSQTKCEAASVASFLTYLRISGNLRNVGGRVAAKTFK